jgi:ATP-dependent RNA helicase DHX37/DHR1
LAGLGDQVARKIPHEEIKLKEDKHKYKYAYQIPDMEEPVIMHSCSVLKKKQPEWVCYQEIYETRNNDSTKMFLRGITAIEPEWLVKFAPKLCSIEKTLEEPVPYYDPQEDKIFCHVKATFGRSGWPLPFSEIEMPETLEKFKYFAMFLLNGEVFEKLDEFKKNLLSSPNTMVKSWSKLVPRTESLASVLRNRQVCSKKKLVGEWKVDKKCKLNFLLATFQILIKKSICRFAGSISRVDPRILALQSF